MVEGNPNSSASRRWYVVSIWTEERTGRPPLWRGALETADGKRLHFANLAELSRLLTNLGGWADPEPGPSTSSPNQS